MTKHYIQSDFSRAPQFRERETMPVPNWHHMRRCLPTVRKTDFQFVNAGSTPASANIFRPHSTMDVQHATNVQVKGSSPFEGSNAAVSEWSQTLSSKQLVEGSIPSSGNKCVDRLIGKPIASKVMTLGSNPSRRARSCRLVA